MRKQIIRRAAAVVMPVAMAAAALCGAVRAQDLGYWRAASSNARSITSDITLANSKVTIDFYTFTMAPIRRLTPVEVSSVFDADVNAGINGMLYRLKIPAEQRLNKKNTLCGDEETQWMATYVTGRTLQVAFFSGDNEPVFTFGAMQGTSTKCGVFAYER
jgi:hypothetical protein